ncbi:MAG TPA: glycoside hydrolase family 20 zincin-like fold domain-containing protein [Opitutus sp.]|nr:glycoside hydrolase family 20 zincin-like fold domain-containing protein [Opitutus sp.]
MIRTWIGCGLGWIVATAVATAALPVVPAPREVVEIKASLTPASALTWQVAAGHTRADLAGGLREALETWRNQRVPAASEGDRATVALGLPAYDEAFRRRCERVGALPDASLGDEGYVLVIDAHGVTAAANAERGLFYALQTLRQILRAAGPGGALPGVRVRDWPEFGFRAVMDDISRGPLSSGDFLRAQIRRVAEMKINRLTWYVEDVVRVPSHPDFAPRGAIPLEEFNELVAYAATYHVELLGSFQTLGHFDKILRVPAYAPLGETTDMLAPAEPRVQRFLSEVIGDMLPVFSQREFLLNGDEAFDLAEAAARRGRTPAELYAEHFRPLIAQVEAAGRVPVLWGDMMLEHRELLELLPKSVLVGTWNYDADVDFTGMIAPFREHGFGVIVCPGVLNSDRLAPLYRETLDNVRGFVGAARAEGARGVLMTAWDDGGMHLFALDWPGIAFAAAQAWNPDAADTTDFFERYDRARGVAAGATGRLTAVTDELSQLFPTWKMNNHYRFERIVPRAGETLTVTSRDWPEVKAIVARARGPLAELGADPEAPAWAWTLDELALHADLRLALARWSTAGVNLAELDELIARQARVRDELRRLWFAENRDHFTTEALQPDTERLADLRALRARVADGGALGVRAEGGQFFTYWLLTGPLAETTSGEDLLGTMGGEVAARPKPGMRFADRAGAMQDWSKTQSDLVAEMDLASRREGDGVVYAYAAIDAERAREVTARLEHTSAALRVLVNGQPVSAGADGHWRLPLVKGRNALLLRLTPPKAAEKAWRFRFDLPDEDVRYRKYRYRVM